MPAPAWTCMSPSFTTDARSTMQVSISPPGARTFGRNELTTSLASFTSLLMLTNSTCRRSSRRFDRFRTHIDYHRGTKYERWRWSDIWRKPTDAHHLRNKETQRYQDTALAIRLYKLEKLLERPGDGMFCSILKIVYFRVEFIYATVKFPLSQQCFVRYSFGCKRCCEILLTNSVLLLNVRTKLPIALSIITT